MADVNVRNYIINQLKPLLPKKWLVKAFNALPDKITTTSVVLVFESYARTTVAPRGPRTANFTLSIVTPQTIPGAADDALDDDVIDLLNAIDTLAETGLRWTTAVRGVASGQPGFDIGLSIPIQLETTDQETP